MLDTNNIFKIFVISYAEYAPHGRGREGTRIAFDTRDLLHALLAP